MKRVFFRTAILCLIAGFTLSGCEKNKDDGKVPVTGVSLNETAKSLTVGETFELIATVAPNDATDKTLEWTSSNPSIASVSGEGTVTALAAGETIITATTADGGKTASCTVSVIEAARITMTTAADEVRLVLSGSGTAIVDWGDGNSGTFALNGDEEFVEHHYTGSSGSRTITINEANITYFSCYNNELTALDVSNSTELTYLRCYNNELTALDVSQNTALTYLHCSENQLTALNVRQNTALTNLLCEENQLTVLDVSQNIVLSQLDCHENPLTTLNVRQNTALTNLTCSNNQLSALDVSQNAALWFLTCSNNQLSALDVSQNTLLMHLNCENNQLNALNVIHNTTLGSLYCSDNNLDASALNALFDSLHSNPPPSPMYTAKSIEIARNPGATGCDRTAAENKGWIFVGE